MAGVSDAGQVKVERAAASVIGVSLIA